MCDDENKSRWLTNKSRLTALLDELQGKGFWGARFPEVGYDGNRALSGSIGTPVRSSKRHDNDEVAQAEHGRQGTMYFLYNRFSPATEFGFSNGLQTGSHCAGRGSIRARTGSVETE
jgi:hypothetical protein